MDDAELAERVRMILITWPGIEILDADDGMPQVRITDGALELAPKVPVLVLTDAAGAMEALQAGASAVLSECVDGDTLCIAIRAAAQGLTTLSAEFRDHLVDSSGFRDALESGAEDEPPPIELTARELQVLRLLAEGASSKSIARRLDMPPHTAKFHVASLVAKLGATGRTDAVAKAMRLGLVMI
jgi:DNA-binding NarL/FixJ family response regulator